MAGSKVIPEDEEARSGSENLTSNTSSNSHGDDNYDSDDEEAVQARKELQEMYKKQDERDELEEKIKEEDIQAGRVKRVKILRKTKDETPEQRKLRKIQERQRRKTRERRESRARERSMGIPESSGRERSSRGSPKSTRERSVKVKVMEKGQSPKTLEEGLAADRTKALGDLGLDENGAEEGEEDVESSEEEEVEEEEEKPIIEETVVKISKKEWNRMTNRMFLTRKGIFFCLKTFNDEENGNILLHRFRSQEERSRKNAEVHGGIVKISPFREFKFVSNLMSACMNIEMTSEKRSRVIADCTLKYKDLEGKDCDMLGISLQVLLRRHFLASTAYRKWIEKYPELKGLDQATDWFQPIFYTFACAMKNEMRIAKAPYLWIFLAFMVFAMFFYDSNWGSKDDNLVCFGCTISGS